MQDAQEPEINTPVEETSSQAEQVVKLVNEERTKAGLPALTVNADITTAANVRANEIKRVFSHTRPDGSSFSTALKEQGVSFRGSGENIAWGQKSPEQVMNAWMNSDGHRANILNKNFKNIGVGHYQDENGEWTPIDNSLEYEDSREDGLLSFLSEDNEQTNDVQDTDGYTTKAGPVNFKFAKNANQKNLVRIQQGDYKLSFALQNRNKDKKA